MIWDFEEKLKSTGCIENVLLNVYQKVFFLCDFLLRKSTRRKRKFKDTWLLLDEEKVLFGIVGSWPVFSCVDLLVLGLQDNMSIFLLKTV